MRLASDRLRDERTHALFLPDSSYAVFVAPMCAAAADAATGDTGDTGDIGDGTGLCRLPVSEAFAISEGDGVNALQWAPQPAHSALPCHSVPPRPPGTPGSQPCLLQTPVSPVLLLPPLSLTSLPLAVRTACRAVPPPLQE